MATKKVGYAKYRLSPLKKITAAAKKLYATGKYAKWTDAIKAASKSSKISGTKSKAVTSNRAVSRPAKSRAVKRPQTVGTISGHTKALCDLYKKQLSAALLKKELATTKKDKRHYGKMVSEARRNVKRYS